MTEALQTRFIAARRRYIASRFSNLNEQQQQAVLATQGPLLLLAGAGSGKTTVLIHRIANLIRFGCASDSQAVPPGITEEDVIFLECLSETVSEETQSRADCLCTLDPAAPWSILAITFTNKAAEELKSRLTAMLGTMGQDVWAMTFHAACCRILRRDIDRLSGYSRSFTIYDAADSERVMKDVIRQMGLDDKTFPPRYVLSAISREKDRMRTPEELIAQGESSGDLRVLHIARAYQTYQNRLRVNNALDFDDIIFLTVRLLQENEDVRTYYQRKFRYVLVDEYQDTNHLQYLLTRLLSGGQENLCVVGDDDQSIYRFRGATIENILNFEREHPSARAIRLEQNYRSTQSILDAANAVVSHNLGRKGKRLWTDNGAGSPILVYEAADESAEGSFVAGQILSKSRGKSFQDYAILYRTNAQSNALEFAMKRSGIPYRVIGGNRFFDRAEVKDMLAYLCVLHNRTDDLRLLRILNVPSRGLGQKAVDTMQRLAQGAGKPLYHVAADPYSYGPLEKCARKLLEFTRMIEELSALLDQGMSLPDFYEELLSRTGYAAMLEQKGTEESKTRLENVRELKSSIQAYVDGSEEPTLGGFLEEIALYTDIEEYHEGDDAVVMMTMHAAKGMEFSDVFLVGFEDGLFPGSRAIGDPEEMEEERRLCYVAITRAKKNLTITYARSRTIYGRTNGTIPSRFLQELPEDCLERRGSQNSGGRWEWSVYGGGRAVPAPSAAPYRAAASRTQPKPLTPEQEACLSLSRGDMVQHNAFGRGMVLTVTKMGGDAMLEVAFDEIGTRRLMAKTAAAHMRKLS